MVDNEAAAICFTTNASGDGIMHAWDDTNWVNVATNALFVDSSTWIGLAAHLVYDGGGEGSWDLYYTTSNQFVSAMTKVGSGPFSFNDGYDGPNEFRELVITNESSVTTYVDAVAVSLSYSPTHTDYTNLVIFERVAGEDTVAAMPPYSYANSQILTGVPPTDMTPLGYDMSIGLFPGDELLHNGVTYRLQHEGSENVWTLPYGGDPSVVSTSAGMLLSRLPGSDTLAFYPYSNLVSWSMQGEAVPNAGVTDGRTDFVVPSTFPGGCIDINDNNSLGFDGADGGDKANTWDEILFFNPTTKRTRKFQYNGTDWTYKGRVVEFEVCPGDAFMYYNKSENSVTWVLADL
jgi:hypothetical protein